MAKDPAFLFYSADFMIGTAFMSNEQIGKYIKLLCFQHQLGHLTEKQMMDVCREKDMEIFSKFKQDSDGLYFNERLEQESLKRNSFCESRRKSRTYVERTSNVRQSHVPRTENVNENEDEDEIKKTTKKNNRKKKFTPPTLEEVTAYCKERNSHIDPETFFHTYESTKWIKANGLPVLNWKSTIVTWEKKSPLKPVVVKPGTPRKEEPIIRVQPDPKQREEVSRLIQQTVKSMGVK